ncbi:hypothetical protein [Bifidobacterium avesanii]|uniref:Uncharacterized protein n=1 Tax=Bifidobacterium avesanii TaxID=1798157 RepID=A0A7K3TGI8_9BIFI|nr:hypothetical protein [Bifidobacterium avesanii]KAB8294533.1 hypothetical protein DSM100685_0326 [Bifidobacterium avesanii]NEG78046.1 hypothetical protein [Bifidobacterium avesanii]
MSGPTRRDLWPTQRALNLDFHADPSRQRTDAKHMAVECMRAMAHALQTGGVERLRVNVPADPATSAVLGASLLRLAAQIDGTAHEVKRAPVRRRGR